MAVLSALMSPAFMLVPYRNGTIEAAQVIEELINIGQQVRQTVENGVVGGLSEDEIIFYDALVENGNAREVLGDAQLRDIAKVLLEQVRRDATIDWAERRIYMSFAGDLLCTKGIENSKDELYEGIEKELFSADLIRIPLLPQDIVRDTPQIVGKITP